MIELLKTKWILFGLEAPVISWAVAFTLLMLTGYWLLRLFLRCRTASRKCQVVAKKLTEIRRRHEGANSRTGLSAAAYDEASLSFEKETSLKSCWRKFDGQLIRRSDGQADYFWSVESAAQSFNEDAIIGAKVNRSFYAALPGIITGVGLLFTFIAILIALLDVRLVNNRVQGIELLIQGLSGKFVSSIVALLCATIFILCEKVLSHRVSKSRLQLVEAIDSLFPRLTLPRLMMAIHNNVSQQTNAIRSFNTDLAPILHQSINASMGPALERMVASIEGLNEHLRQSAAQSQGSLSTAIGQMIASLDNLNQHLAQTQAQKQTSIAEETKRTLEELSGSLKDSIGQMSAAFSDALSGGARDEFSLVIQALSNTRGLLDDTNRQFTNAQNAIATLIDLAKSSTSEQIKEGQIQMAAMTAKIEKLMEQMGQKLEASAATTTDAAQNVITRAEAWSAQSAGQLASLLNSHQQQAMTVSELRGALETTLKGFNEAISKQTDALNGLRPVTSQVAATVSAIGEAVQKMQHTQQSLQQVAAQAEAQVKELGSANQHQEQVRQYIQSSMVQYEKLFQNVEDSAAALLGEINQQLKDLMAVSNQGFQQLVNQADNHFSTATQRLAAMVEELNDPLDTLSEQLSKLQVQNNGHGS
jgi:hypothetical protein